MEVERRRTIVFEGKTVKVTEIYDESDMMVSGCYQPYFCCECGKESLVIDDFSCGELGTRITAIYSVNGIVTAWACYGTMLEDEEQKTSFYQLVEKEMFWVRFAAEVGYVIPVVDK